MFRVKVIVFLTFKYKKIISLIYNSIVTNIQENYAIERDKWDLQNYLLITINVFLLITMKLKDLFTLNHYISH